MTAVSVSAATATDWSDCAREPIHIPGGIQPHGFLFSVDLTGKVLQASANAAALHGKQALEAILGAPLEHIIGVSPAETALAALRALESEGTPVHAGSMRDPRKPPPGGKPYSPLAIVVHRFKGQYLVELEPAQGTADVFASMYALVRGFISNLQDAQDVAGMAALAVREVHRITGFGRTMLYRFDEEGNGHVLAEAVEPGNASYLDQRFPAYDIPAQARALYVLNRIRLIADAAYQPVPLVPAAHPSTGLPTDLTYASLRSVSPVHVQYMKNMRTMASMSMSIVVRGRLWGLISCHDLAPRLPPFEVRTACEHISQVLSLQIEAKEEHAQAAHRLELRRILSRLLAAMSNTENFVDALRDDPRDLLELTGASGAAVLHNGRIELVGTTPDETSVNALVAWLDGRSDKVYFTDHLAGTGALPAAPGWAGFLAVPISKLFRNYVIWFRAEVVHSIKWAGNPREKLQGLSDSLSPRASFELWTETVRGHSRPWSTAEQEIAVELQTALLGIVLRRTEEIAGLAMELGRANRELEGFSYTVSHDLRAPLRHIVAFGDLLRELEGTRISERGAQYLSRIVGAARFGGELVDDLLAFSQMGRAALRLQRIELGAMVGEMIGRISAAGGGRIEWQVGELPAVTADPVLLHVVLQNLVENAVKFSAPRERPRVEIGHRRGAGELEGHDVFFVRDNGVGFDMRYVDKLFGVFERLHQQDEFSGTGIGLATVRRVVERHGGRTWAEGEPDQGATLHFTLPHKPVKQHDPADNSAVETLRRLVALNPEGQRTPIPKEAKETM